ncbi:MAG TPA: hypothetical protein VIG97_11925 [Luteimonas sp.]
MLTKKITSGVAGLLLAASAAFALPVQEAAAETTIVICINDNCVIIVVR